MAVRPIDAMELKQRMCALCNQYYSDEPCEPSDCVFVRAINEAPTLTPPNEPRAGLYGKYTVYKNKDGSLVTDCFILRPAKDPAAVAALRAYAAATDNAELAADIISWVGAEPNEPLTQADLDGMDYDKVWIDYEDGTGEWALVCNGYIYSIDTLEGAGLDFVDYMRGEKLEPHGYKVYSRPPEGEA